MRKKIYSKIKNFLPYFNEFGFKEGYRLYKKLSSSDLDNIQVYGIKHPISLRKNEKSDLEVFKQVFIEKQYMPYQYKNPKIIIDAGGNVGLFSVLMKNNFPDAKFITIEPDYDNFLMAEKNLKNYSDVKDGKRWKRGVDSHKNSKKQKGKLEKNLLRKTNFLNQFNH